MLLDWLGSCGAMLDQADEKSFQAADERR